MPLVGAGAGERHRGEVASAQAGATERSSPRVSVPRSSRRAGAGVIAGAGGPVLNPPYLLFRHRLGYVSMVVLLM